jgi:murein DD-endopeptidase MepM/ murein hydrolase activator NlpD
MLLKIYDGKLTNTALDVFSRLVKSPGNYGETAETFVSFFTDAIYSLTGKDLSIKTSEVPDLFAPPLAEGSILTAFEDSVHPVFNTSIKPIGISISSQSEAIVSSICSGTVTSVVDNSNGTYRVVVSYNKGVKVAYDNLASVYVKTGDEVLATQVLGILTAETPSLSLEMWVNNEAQDPLDYIGQIY